ncbi:hypothetical protein TRFO_39692 [Tritrichomonas foetus]|uniref:Vps16 C-terminal domain-containing protein n=1 Tax=Tritrichomonas foetus TaxID=1144522 RepID=A0A1J4J650_9EUKA|nr:hypothetical protein TRFO_39692 [Tritrichomonas foetus]|eukprot:OHS94137.1 hypothetical protein TRFO_39692 [Tritrichomonas foetus]
MLEEIWPKSRRSIEIGNRKYQTAALYSYDTYEMDNTDTRFLPGPCGGYLIKFRAQGSQSFVDIYANNGTEHDRTSCISCTSSTNVDIRNAFWCNNGFVGLLDYKGGVSIMTLSGEKVAYYPLKIDIDRVAADYPFNGGIAFYTEGPYNFYIFEYTSQTSYPLCPEGKFDKSATGVAYGDGKGFVAFVDNTLAIVTDSEVQLINKFDFTPYVLILSPHNNLLAARDDFNLYVRSTTSNSAFPPICSKYPIGDVAFLDETTVSFVVKLEGKPTVLTFQQGQQVSVEFFQSKCRVSHLIQDFETVRVYRTALEDGNEFTELYLVTPVHDSINTLLSKPWVDRLELLLQSQRYFEQENIDSYKILEDLRGKDKDHDELKELVTLIMDAAPHILDTPVAEILMKNAAFGKYRLKGFNHDEFAKTIKEMQMLYNLRKHEGFVTTETDFEIFEKADFLSILVQLKKYELAEIIAQKFHLNRSIIAENWAIDMFNKYRKQVDSDSSQYSTKILRILQRFDQVDFLRVAEMAILYGLSEFDIRKMIACISDPQVRMNFIMKNHSIYKGTDDALNDVIKSKDGDAIISYLCIKRDLLPSTFGPLLASNPVLQEHYSAFKSQQYAPPNKQQGYQKVLSIESYHPIKKFQLELTHGCRATGYGLGREQLNVAKRYLGGGPNIWSQCVDNQLALITEMENLGWSPPRRPDNDPTWRPPPTRSARFCMEKAVLDGKEAVFKKIAKQFKVSDATQCWIKMRTYAKTNRWDDLLAMSRKSQPVEWEDFVDLCAEFGNADATLTFIDKISNTEKKIDLLVFHKFYQKAAEVAKNSKNMQRYNEILSMM